LGGAVGFVGNLAGIENGAAITAGILMVVAGVIMLDLFPAKGLQKFNPLNYTSRILKPLGSRISSPSAGSKFSLGLLLGFMPCGLIYAALLKAISTGSVFAGSLTMMAFGIGTAASLLGIGILSFAFSLRLSRWGNRMAAISVLLLGFFLIARGAMPMMAATHEKQEVPACHNNTEAAAEF
jgi:sulfite exporter TauE/SafE